MRRIIDHAVGFVVEASGSVRRWRGCGNECKRKNSRRDEELHGSASSCGLGAGAPLSISSLGYSAKNKEEGGCPSHQGTSLWRGCAAIGAVYFGFIFPGYNSGAILKPSKSSGCLSRGEASHEVKIWYRTFG